MATARVTRVGSNRLAAALDVWRTDPVLFVRTMLKAEPKPHQIASMMAVADPDVRQVAKRSGRQVGKTTEEDWLSIWFPMTFPDARVIVTAPSSGQLDDAFIPGMRSWLQRLPAEIYDLWKQKADRFEFKPAERLGYENFVTIRTARADQPESLQGINARNILVIVDEAAGVPDIVLEALSGSMGSGNATMALYGNPNRNTGFFHEAFSPRKAEHWRTFHVSSVDDPMVSRSWIEEKKIDWGEDSNAYRIHVLGEFARGDDDAVIPMHLIQSAIGRQVEVVGNVSWGLDVAAFGPNVTALAKRRGNALLEPVRCWKGLESMEVVGAVKQEWDVTPASLKPYEILVDALGPGSGVASRLREQKVPARDINVSELPALTGKYANARSEIWYRAREWFEKRDCTIPNDPDLIADLAMPTYRFTSGGKVFVQGKATRLKDFKGMTRSPDRGDAFCLTFAGANASLVHGAPDRDHPVRRGIRGIV